MYSLKVKFSDYRLLVNNPVFELMFMGALQPAILPVVFALVMTAVFDATGPIRAVAGQANLLDKDGQIINGGKALTADSVSSLLSGYLVPHLPLYILNLPPELLLGVKQV